MAKVQRNFTIDHDVSLLMSSQQEINWSELVNNVLRATVEGRKEDSTLGEIQAKLKAMQKNRADLNKEIGFLITMEQEKRQQLENETNKRAKAGIAMQKADRASGILWKND